MHVLSSTPAKARPTAVARSPLILREKVDPAYEPTCAETLEYAAFIGFDVSEGSADLALLHVARAGLKAPVPKEWSPCRDPDSGDVYYFNFATGESIWEHPNDAIFREKFLHAARALRQARLKRATAVPISSHHGDTTKRSEAPSLRAPPAGASTPLPASIAAAAAAAAAAPASKKRLAPISTAGPASVTSCSTPTPTGGGAVKQRSPSGATSRRLRSELAACRVKLALLEQRSSAGDKRIAAQDAALGKERAAVAAMSAERAGAIASAIAAAERRAKAEGKTEAEAKVEAMVKSQVDAHVMASVAAAAEAEAEATLAAAATAARAAQWAAERAAATTRYEEIVAQLAAASKRVRKLAAQRDAAAAVASDWALSRATKAAAATNVQGASASATEHARARANADTAAETAGSGGAARPSSTGGDSTSSCATPRARDAGAPPRPGSKPRRSASAMRLKTLQTQATRVTMDLKSARAQLARAVAELRAERSAKAALESALKVILFCSPLHFVRILLTI